MAVIPSWVLGRRCQGEVWVRFLQVSLSQKDREHNRKMWQVPIPLPKARCTEGYPRAKGFVLKKKREFSKYH